jgi:hypothetical protein
MDGRRSRLEAPQPAQLSNVHEPELDMRRCAQAPAGVFARVYGSIRKLIVDGRGAGSPMRSIARELEESWPSGEY